jgi:hypothetical protein
MNLIFFSLDNAAIITTINDQVSLKFSSKFAIMKFIFSRTIRVEEVPLPQHRKKKFGICSLPVRIVCETLFVLLVFVPVLLFLFKWPSAKNLIHGKVLSVSLFPLIQSMKKLFFYRKPVLHQCLTVLKVGPIHQ